MLRNMTTGSFLEAARLAGQLGRDLTSSDLGLNLVYRVWPLTRDSLLGVQMSLAEQAGRESLSPAVSARL